MIQDAFTKQRAKSKAKIKKLKAELQAQQPKVVAVGTFQSPSKIYSIKSEKSQQAFYIIELLEYMQSKIENIIISEAIANNASKCNVINKALNK
ncbi:16408_t:CDS:2, partial [Gigaspora rosea]